MPMQVDVFNGDADGLCALQQLHLHDPQPSLLVTGVKRHINLLHGLVLPTNTILNVLDISFDANAQAVTRLLAQGVRIFYSDHHQATQLPQHPNLTTRIHFDPHVCTSLLVNAQLQGTYGLWAAVGAFGDNMPASAKGVLSHFSLNATQNNSLQELGQLLNYNGYGENLEDLFFHPARLARMLRPYASPFDFIANPTNSQMLHTLRTGLSKDLALANATKPVLWADNTGDHRAITWLLPAKPWARRVMGVFANQQAQAMPHKAIALGVPNRDGSWRFSVRAPLQNPYGANTLAAAFPSGGGRAGAAGIAQLPPTQLQAFIQAFIKAF